MFDVEGHSSSQGLERPLGLQEAEAPRMYRKSAGKAMGPRLKVESLPIVNGKVQDTFMSRL